MVESQLANSAARDGGGCGWTGRVGRCGCDHLLVRLSLLQEHRMAPTWTVRRQISPHRDGDRRWDQAYQLLMRWAMARPDGDRAVGPMPQEVPEAHVYRDDGYSGASLGRPGLDRLRDHAALADLDVVLVVAPDRLARNYVHQVLLVDELARHGCRVEFLDRPMSQDPHDQLLLEIRVAVAEYERTLIAERMRRGRQ